MYLNAYATMGELQIGLSKSFTFYNEQRPHQALGHQTPHAVYQSAKRGGALIIDKYGVPEPASISPAVDKALAPIAPAQWGQPLRGACLTHRCPALTR